MDFFEQANSHVRDLNESERKIFEYVIRNVSRVKDMQIRALAAACFVSTTTIMRFAKKLGFSGYRELIDSLRLASHVTAQSELPSVLKYQTYGEEYLKNIIESARVITPGKVQAFGEALANKPRICCFGTGLDEDVARYAYRLLMGLGYRTLCPTGAFERQSAIDRLEDGDVLFLFSMSGEDPDVLDLVERVRLVCDPVIVAMTHSANNTLQVLSNIDLYVFAEKICIRNRDLSSRASMFSILELLSHSLIKAEM